MNNKKTLYIFKQTNQRRLITNTILLETCETGNLLDQYDEHDLLKFLLEMAGCRYDKDILAATLLNEFGSLKNVLEARNEQLIKVKGVGRKTAYMIRMVVHFTRVWQRLNMDCPERIGNSFEAEKYCKSLLSGLRNEQFYVVCMNANCQVLGRRKISEGSLSEVNAYPRMVIETALNYNAHSILLCHNHPGGTNRPSPEDISSTLTLQRVLKGIGILVLDHVIVAGDNAYSMIQHGDITY